MASKYSKTDFITSMDDSDLELYNAAELWSPANMETQNCKNLFFTLQKFCLLFVLFKIWLGVFVTLNVYVCKSLVYVAV